MFTRIRKALLLNAEWTCVNRSLWSITARLKAKHKVAASGAAAGSLHCIDHQSPLDSLLRDGITRGIEARYFGSPYSPNSVPSRQSAMRIGGQDAQQIPYRTRRKLFISTLRGLPACTLKPVPNGMTQAQVPHRIGIFDDTCLARGLHSTVQRRYDKKTDQPDRETGKASTATRSVRPSYHGSVKLLLPPQPSHVQSRKEMLADVEGLLPRLHAHVKFTLMRRHRPWSIDDFMALFSWIFMSNAAFILVGTTTFVSLLLALANSLQFQQFIALRVGEYLTQETGIQFLFESAIVPNWRDGKIRLRNVVLTRGPQKRPVSERVSGSCEEMPDDTAATDAIDAFHINDNTDADFDIVIASPVETYATSLPLNDDQLFDTKRDTNLSMFHLTVEQVEVTLNMLRWFDGKGLVEHCSIGGVRGVIDRTHVFWEADPPYIPAQNRHPGQPGDFELESFAVQDVLVTILQPEGFRPYQLSILSASASRLRKRWLLYDMLCADSIVGVFDGCLFSMHRAQRPGSAAEMMSAIHAQDGNRRVAELRIDGVAIDHLNAGVPGPFGWITSATVDISAHITFPHIAEDDSLVHLIRDLVDRVDAVNAARRHIGAFHDDIATVVSQLSPHPPTTERARSHIESGDDLLQLLHLRSAELVRRSPSKLIVDLNVRFNNVKASVPPKTQELSYVNSALIRPVVAYMNWHRTCIPVRCSFAIDLGEFDGSWTVYEAGLVDVISEEVGRALVQLATDERERNRRLKRVGLWGLQSVTRNLISVMDHLRGFKERGMLSRLSSS